MLKTKTWVILILSVLILCLILSAVALVAQRKNTVVEIVQDGKVLRRIDLFETKEEYSFIVEWEDGGTNTITVQPGRICVSDADCPDKICVEQGWISSGAIPIICMPHRLVIQFAEGESFDAVAK